MMIACWLLVSVMLLGPVLMLVTSAIETNNAGK